MCREGGECVVGNCAWGGDTDEEVWRAEVREGGMRDVASLWD